jgi:hypothetical protein
VSTLYLRTKLLARVQGRGEDAPGLYRLPAAEFMGAFTPKTQHAKSHGRSSLPRSPKARRTTLLQLFQTNDEQEAPHELSFCVFALFAEGAVRFLSWLTAEQLRSWNSQSGREALMRILPDMLAAAGSLVLSHHSEAVLYETQAALDRGQAIASTSSARPELHLTRLAGGETCEQDTTGSVGKHARPEHHRDFPVFCVDEGGPTAASLSVPLTPRSESPSLASNKRPRAF